MLNLKKLVFHQKYAQSKTGLIGVFVKHNIFIFNVIDQASLVKSNVKVFCFYISVSFDSSRVSSVQMEGSR